MNEINSYLSEYDDITTLGRGASGFVQLAKRKVDRFEVKFNEIIHFYLFFLIILLLRLLLNIF